MITESKLRKFEILNVDLSNELNEKGHKDYFIIRSKSKIPISDILKENITAIVLWGLLLLGYVKRTSIIKNQVIPDSVFLWGGLVVLIYTIISCVISAYQAWNYSVEHYYTKADAEKELTNIIAKDDLHFAIKEATKNAKV
jgi:hypothetical protein